MTDTIHKDDLSGKFVEYIDNKGMMRISKVHRVRGKKLSVVIPGKKKRKVIDARRVLNNIHHGHCRRQIDWSIRRKK